MGNYKNHAKKISGEFYTPEIVIEYMIQRIFNLLEDQGRITMFSFSKFIDSLERITFCDPALGTGNFILGILQKIRSISVDFPDYSEKKYSSFIKKFLCNNIFGIELSRNSLQVCKKRLKDNLSLPEGFELRNFKLGNTLVNEDAFDILQIEETSLLRPFSWENFSGNNSTFDIIIGNPPYFNLKKMILLDDQVRLLFTYLRKSKFWRGFYRSSSDVYYYFLIKSLLHLKENGLLSFILPNSWIENKYADKLREFLLNYGIVEIVDLGPMLIFKEEGRWLNIENSILTIQNKPALDTFQIVKNDDIRVLDRDKFIGEIMNNYNRFNIAQTSLNKEKWILSPNLSFIREIEKNPSVVQLGEIATVAQGMSPGLKSVFVLSEEEVKKHEIEDDVLVPFITNRSIKKWFCQDSKKKCILPSKVEDISKYVNCYRYLNSYKEELQRGPDRQRLLKKGQIRFYDFSVYRNLNLFLTAKKKIICPYRSYNNRFAVDLKGLFGATDIYAIVPNDENMLYYLLGILNSTIFEFWYKEAGKRKGKMLEFFSHPLRKSPIPLINEKEEIKDHVKSIVKMSTRERGKETTEIVKKQAIIDQLIVEGMGIKQSDFEKILKLSSKL